MWLHLSRQIYIYKQEMLLRNKEKWSAKLQFIIGVFSGHLFSVINRLWLVQEHHFLKNSRVWNVVMILLKKYNSTEIINIAGTYFRKWVV